MNRIATQSFAVFIALFGAATIAAPVTYKIDPGHTYPSFESDHQNGLSFWRGKFNSSSGIIIYDKDARSGTVDILIDTASVDFGHDIMSERARTYPDMLDAAKFPTANYKGTLIFSGDRPTGVKGELTLHGVTKPVDLKINSFLCRANTVRKIETCGADAITTINRDDFGVDWGKPNYKMETTLRIQVEASAPVP